MIRILAIGNSFSQDATKYLHDMDNQTKVVNLHIGGCSLCTHWDNVIEDAANYDYVQNGVTTGRKASIKEALLEDAWDYVTLQQVSCDSGFIDTYFPYLTDLSNYVKKYVPNAKQLIHQTWAYEVDCTHSAFEKYGCSQSNMYRMLKEAYREAAQIVGVDIIPCGDVIQALRSLEPFDYMNGGQSLCRDGYHMNFVYGRYATAAVWYMTILGKSILDNKFLPPEVEDEGLIDLIKRTVYEIV